MFSNSDSMISMYRNKSMVFSPFLPCPAHPAGNANFPEACASHYHPVQFILKVSTHHLDSSWVPFPVRKFMVLPCQHKGIVGYSRGVAA